MRNFLLGVLCALSLSAVAQVSEGLFHATMNLVDTRLYQLEQRVSKLEEASRPGRVRLP
jgi:hypothetical protein